MMKAIKNWQLFRLLIELYVIFRFCSSINYNFVDHGEGIDEKDQQLLQLPMTVFIVYSAK